MNHKLVKTVELVGLLVMLIGESSGEGNLQGGTLEERVLQRKVSALLQAGDQSRFDLIPLLEQVATAPLRPTDPSHICAVEALAKLGVKKYYDEIVGGLVNPQASPLYRAEGIPFLSDTDAVWRVQAKALRSLEYLKDKSTVKYIAPFILSDVKRTEIKQREQYPIGWLAIEALSQMNLEDTPPPRGVIQTGTTESIHAWQQWWKRSKDYYEKLEFGKPVPPMPAALIAPPMPPVITSNNPVAPKPVVPAPAAKVAGRPRQMPEPEAVSAEINWRLVIVLGSVTLIAGGLVAFLIRRRKG